MTDDALNDLDAAAHANLGDRGFSAYQTYKAELLAEQTPPDELEMVLRGWIWDEAEAKANSEAESVAD